jgi:phosphoserine phosphatase RsbU/P
MTSIGTVMKNRGLALKLTVLILSSISVIFFLIFSYNYAVSRRIIVSNIEKNARNLSLATVNRIDRVLNAIEKVPENLAAFAEHGSHASTDYIDLIRMVVENNPEIFGATIAFEPYVLGTDTPRFAPYFYKKEGEIKYAHLAYDYFFRDWYQIPKELNRPAWTEPYFDEEGGQIIMATYSVPFYKVAAGEKKFMGVVTADISLEWLQKIVDSIKIEETGYGFLLSKNGTFVTHPDLKLVMNETIFSVAEARKDPELRTLGRKLIRGEKGFAPFQSLVTGKACWMVYAPLATSSWSLGVLFPQTELMADITRLNGTVLFLAVTGFFIIFAVIIWIAGTITRPLRALSRATEHVAVGNLDAQVPPIKTGDEVGKLARSFDAMQTSLKQYIQELTETTAARERIESELKIAHDIQMGIIPKTFPPFPDLKEFELFASIVPAKEVGGDLYDFFFMDEDHLCFVVGDVSGKGIPAALFMAVTRTLIKTKASQLLNAGAVLTRVNEDLSLENPSLMFVTVFLGILNIRTGEIEYANAGHNPPYIMGRNGSLKPVEQTGGIILGVEEEAVYQSKKLVLEKGEAIFVFTDGVTEAMNETDELFSEKRLEERLKEIGEKPVTQILSAVMASVEEFAQDAPQADDITMLALRFCGKP